MALALRGRMTALALGCVACCAVFGGGCSRDPYSQATPEETLAAAKLMVKNGEAEKLPRLIHADNPDMRRWLNTTGRLMGSLESLAIDLQAAYPTEVAELRQRAEQAAKEGRAISLIGQVVQQARGSTRGQTRTPLPLQGAARNRVSQAQNRETQRDAFSDGLTRLFTDPYAFLNDAEGRLTVVTVDDETAALQWDGKPALAPLGVVMRRSEADEKWYIVLPTNVPGVDRFMPQSSDQWTILSKLVVTLDKMVVDLDSEVKAGQHASLGAVSRRAGEMTFVPAVMVMYAYAKYTQEAGPVAGSPP